MGMSQHEPIDTKNLDIYGHAPLEWSRVRDQVVRPADAMTAYWLGTVRPNGRPHAAGVGAGWYDGELYFTTSPDARKGRNLAANPACTISVRLEGIDLVLEGMARRVSDPDELEGVAAMYRDVGWPAKVDGDALTAPYSAPSAGPPPWHVFRFEFHTAFAVASAEPHGATRWRFER
jgi:hypothetical protein